MVKYFEDCDNEAKDKHAKELEDNKEIKLAIEGKDFVLTEKHISFKVEQKNQMEEKFVPWVIEPSFGIGRILYCIFEHCFKVREKDAQRTYFDFPSFIAPIHTSLLPLMSKPDMIEKCHAISKRLQC